MCIRDRREGRFSFDGVEYQLEVDFPPHAKHGVGYRTGWEANGSDTVPLDLEGLWPFGGRAEQHVEISGQSMMATMSVRAVDRMPVAPGPWGDCLGDVTVPPMKRWPGFGSIRLESNMTSWVVYTEAPDLLCREPQTEAPDAFNRDPMILEPGETLDVWMRISWELE